MSHYGIRYDIDDMYLLLINGPLGMFRACIHMDHASFCKMMSRGRTRAGPHIIRYRRGYVLVRRRAGGWIEFKACGGQHGIMAAQCRRLQSCPAGK